MSFSYHNGKTGAFMFLFYWFPPYIIRQDATQYHDSPGTIDFRETSICVSGLIVVSVYSGRD